MIPCGAQAARQALQFSQSAVPNLQVLDSSLQVVGELWQLLHRPNVLHENLLLEKEEEEKEEEDEKAIRGNKDSTQIPC